MGTKETQIVVALAWPIIEWLLNGKTDTTELKKKVDRAESDQAKKDVVIEAVVNEIGEMGEVGVVIKDVINAGNTEQVIEVVTRPNVVQGILNAIGGLFAAVFGGKKRK